MMSQGNTEEDDESDLSFCGTNSVSEVGTEDEESQTMSNISREISNMQMKLDQVLEILGACKLEVPNNPKQAEKLLNTALDLKGLGPMVQQCSQVLEKNLNAENVIKMFRLATEKLIDRLLKTSTKFILRNFMQIHNQKDLVELGEDELSTFLSSDDLQVASEEVVFETILRWIRHDANKRKHCIGTLVNAVRYYNCDVRFLRGLRDHYYLWENAEFQKVIRPIILELETGSPEVQEKANKTKRH